MSHYLFLLLSCRKTRRFLCGLKVLESSMTWRMFAGSVWVLIQGAIISTTTYKRCKKSVGDGMPGYFSLDAKLKCSTKSMGRLRRVGVEDSEIIMITLHVKISQITKTTIIATRSYFSSSMLTQPFFKESPRLLQFSRYLSRHAA